MGKGQMSVRQANVNVVPRGSGITPQVAPESINRQGERLADALTDQAEAAGYAVQQWGYAELCDPTKLNAGAVDLLILPEASTTQTLEASKDTSIPA